TASRAVIGLPARWLFAVEKELPPAGEAEARSALRLQAERLALAESGEVVCDFVGRPNSGAPTRVLLVGMLRQRLERVEQLAGGGERGDLLRVDAVGLPNEQLQELSSRLGMPVRAESGLSLLGIEAPPEPSGAGDGPVEAFAVPLSLALAGARPELLPLDFAH